MERIIQAQYNQTIHKNHLTLEIKIMYRLMVYLNFCRINFLNVHNCNSCLNF